MDQFEELYTFIQDFRKHSSDDIVIYTGYTEDELGSELAILQYFPNIIIKFGRYRPNEESHLDDVLGVKLASSNQYAKNISIKS